MGIIMDNFREIKSAKNVWHTATLILVSLFCMFTGAIMYAFSTQRIRLVTDAERNALMAQELPLATRERLEHELAAVLPGTFEVTTNGKDLAIHVDLSGEAKSDITYRRVVRVFAKVLSAVHASGYQDLEAVSLSATYPVEDHINNTTVASVTLDRKFLNNVNWDHILRSDVFEAAEQYQLHPILRTTPVAHAE